MDSGLDLSKMPVIGRIRELDDALSSSVIAVGWIDGNGTARKAYANLMKKMETGKDQKALGKPASIALIARTLNYGRLAGTTADGRKYPEIPARPFMKFAAEIWEREFPKILGRMMPSYLRGGMSIDGVLKTLGERARNAVQKAIREGDYAPLSPRTIKAKGSSTPLIDTGLMVNSVTFEIRNGG